MKTGSYILLDLILTVYEVTDFEMLFYLFQPSTAPFNVTITGNGFTKTHDTSKVICNFKLNDTDNQGKVINSDFIVTSYFEG